MDSDVLIIGGSFAGLSAALQLGRARVRTVVVDAGKPRNRFAAASHGFLGRDGHAPGDILAEARRELAAYATVSLSEGSATAARAVEGGFAVTIGGAEHLTRRLVLATGISDGLPPVPGLADLWGKAVFHCPYCHGYELERGRIAYLVSGEAGLHMARLLPEWGDLTLLTDGVYSPPAEMLAGLTVPVAPAPLASVAPGPEGLTATLADGSRHDFAGLFVSPRTEVGGLAASLGCEIADWPGGTFLRVNERQGTSVPGVFACGDAARGAGNVAFAVGSGAMAGTAAHHSLVFGL